MRRKKLSVTLIFILALFSTQLLTAQPTPFSKVRSSVERTIIDGEEFVQRDLTKYVIEISRKTNPDYHGDEEEKHWLYFVNRPHPSVETIEKYFNEAAKEFGVPPEILKAIGYVENNWTQIGPSIDGGWGIMHLVDNDYSQTLQQAAKLLELDPEVLKDNPRQNIRGAAALLAYHAGKKRSSLTDLEDWFEPVKQITGLIDDDTREMAAELYFDAIREGAVSSTLWNEKVKLEAHPNVSVKDKLIHKQRREKNTRAVDYPGAVDELTTCNYSSRNGVAIDTWVNHYIGTGTIAGALSWFKNCDANVSAHFTIDRYGTVYQSVRVAYKAWHCGATGTNNNARSIGIEHDATVSNPETWNSTEMLVESANVARYFCDMYGIPKQRSLPGVQGHNDMPGTSTSCPGPIPWDTWFNYLNSGGVPARPTLRGILSSDSNKGITAIWASAGGATGYRLYYATSDFINDWQLAADESTLGENTTSVTLTPSEFIVPPSGDIYFFKLTAVNENGESAAGDIYGRSSNADGSGLPKILIVDGFDRNGSYTGLTHTFATDYIKAIRENGNYVFSTAANEAVADGGVSMSGYDMVFWFVGDESTNNETFSSYEQTKVKNYLEAGGKLFVTGSEIGWDLYNKGTSDDQSFYTNYFKANFAGDGGSGRAPATGTGDFNGADMNFGQTYTEDYPDEITPRTGASAIMTYANSATGGIAYNGVFGSGSQDGALVYIAFPFETVSDYTQKATFMGKVLDYFNDGSPTASFSVSGLPAAAGDPVSFDASASSDPDGSIASYAWDFGDGNTGSGQTVTHTYAADDNYTVTLTVTDNESKTGQAAQELEITACPSPDNVDTYIDNMDSECTTVGTWAESTSNPNYYGTNYIHDSGTLKGEKTVTFTPNITANGYYEVYERHTAGTNRATNVPIEISTNGNTSTVYVNQQNDDGAWVLLGTYYFEIGTSGTITIKNEGTSDVVIADAIKLTFVGCENPNAEVTADFSTPVTNLPSGTSVIFTNKSTDATSYSWSFEGGNPATSTDENPIVSYSTPGTYNVTLTAQNGSVTDSKSMTITVYDGGVQAFDAKYESRGVWLTTNWNLDWPSASGLSVASQQAELENILDLISDANFNTVYLQVRSRGDLLYPSNIEPWAACLNGLGVDPGYDPLAFAIQEAHERGLEVHAWMCTYRVYSNATPPSTTPAHVVNAHPEWVKNYTEGSTTTKWLDPGIPAVNEYLLTIVEEIATNYPSLDGIQFDYIRYPNSDFSDDDTYSTYGSGWSNKDDWRRNNVNQFVYAAYETATSINPDIKIGSAPIGIYQCTSDFCGWQGYSDIMQDSRDWMSKNRHDYACPQIYWDLSSNPKFDLVANDWVQNSFGKHIYTGIHTSSLAASRAKEGHEEHTFVLSKEKKSRGTWEASEIQNQIDAARTKDAKGQSFYRTESFIDDVQNIRTLLKNNQYQYPAIVPPMPWKDGVEPNVPQNLTLTENSETSYTLSWTAPAAAGDGDGAAFYIVYASASESIDVSTLANMERFRVTGTSIDLSFDTAPTSDIYYTVTAVDDGNNESNAPVAVMLEGQTSTETVTVIDDFEIDMGHFNLALDYSGSTVGIDGGSSSKARVTNYPKNGSGSLEIVLNDDSGSSSNWVVRTLSGGGSPANNVSIPANAKIRLWLATSSANANAKIYLWIDDSDGIEQSTQLSLINDGTYHLYEWDLTDNAVWSAFTGNGAIDGATVTIDAIMLSSPNASATWTLYVDDVAYSTEGGCVTPSVTEIIVDNNDAATTGTWATSTSNPNYYGTNYIHDSGSLKGQKYVTFSPAIEADGYYEVFERHTAGTNRAYDTQVEINGTSTVCVNQQVNDATWVSLGTHFFAAGNGSVVLKNANTENVVIADAIKLVYVGCEASYVTLNLPVSISVGTSNSYNGIASADIDHVIVKVDGWEIANETVTNGAYSFDYSFNGAGTPREFVAYAYDASSNLIATLTQHKTVSASGMKQQSEELTEISVDELQIEAKLYPNPAHHRATLEMNLPETMDVNITVHDLQGRMIDRQKLYNVNGTVNHTLNLVDYQEGIYLVKIESGEYRLITKLVIME